MWTMFVQRFACMGGVRCYSSSWPMCSAWWGIHSILREVYLRTVGASTMPDGVAVGLAMTP